MSILEKYAYVFFVCEGKNEEAVFRLLEENGKIDVKSDSYSTAFLRTRSHQGWEKLRSQCFEYDYGGDVAVVYLLDSKNEKRELLKSKVNKKIIPVIKVLTPPEIEILLILAHPDVEKAWERASRQNRQLKPSEFCKAYYKCDIKNGDNFISKFESFDLFLKACKEYKTRHKDQVCIYDIIKL